MILKVIQRLGEGGEKETAVCPMPPVPQLQVTGKKKLGDGTGGVAGGIH